MSNLIEILAPVGIGAFDALIGGFLGAGTGYLMRKTVRNKVRPENYQSQADYEAAFKKEANKVAWVGTLTTAGASCAVGAASTYVLCDVIPEVTGSHHGGSHHSSSTSNSTGSTTTTVDVDPDVADVAGE